MSAIPKPNAWGWVYVNDGSDDEERQRSLIADYILANQWVPREVFVDHDQPILSKCKGLLDLFEALKKEKMEEDTHYLVISGMDVFKGNRTRVGILQAVAAIDVYCVKDAMCSSNMPEVSEWVDNVQQYLVIKHHQRVPVVAYGHAVRVPTVKFGQLPGEGIVLKTMLWMYDENATYDEIAAALNEKGLKTRTGKDWTYQNVMTTCKLYRKSPKPNPAGDRVKQRMKLRAALKRKRDKGT